MLVETIIHDLITAKLTEIQSTDRSVTFDFLKIKEEALKSCEVARKKSPLIFQGISLTTKIQFTHVEMCTRKSAISQRAIKVDINSIGFKLIYLIFRTFVI